MSAKAKMTYFKFHGLGEPVRYMLAFAGVQWEEELVEVQDFPALKPKLPYGKLPVLELDGITMHQSAAILRYLARRAGDLYGVTPMDSLLCDVAYDTISDLRTMMLSYFYEPHAESQAQKKKHALEVLTPMYMQNLEELVVKNGGHFVNGKLSWVDIAYAGLIDYLSHMAGTDLLAEHPTLRALRDKVNQLPPISKYRQTRQTFDY